MAFEQEEDGMSHYIDRANDIENEMNVLLEGKYMAGVVTGRLGKQRCYSVRFTAGEDNTEYSSTSAAFIMSERGSKSSYKKVARDFVNGEGVILVEKRMFPGSWRSKDSNMLEWTDEKEKEAVDP